MSSAGSLDQAVVLAHGRGDDCFPYGGKSAFRPKYAMEVNCVPLVRRVVDALRGVGARRILVATGFRGEAVQAVFNDLPEADRPEFVDVEPFDHGDAPVLATVVDRAKLTGPLLIMNGDLSVQTREIEAVRDAFAEAGGEVACALVDDLPDDEDKLSWHTVVTDTSSNKITAFRGATEDGVHRLSGLYAIPADATAKLTQPPTSSADDRVYLARHLGEMLGEAPIVAVRASTHVVHVDRCFDYLEANQQHVRFEVDRIAERTGAYVYRGGEGEPDPTYIYPGTIIHRGATIVCQAGAFISPYDTLEDHLAAIKDAPRQAVPIRIRGNVYLGERAHIGLGSVIEGGLVMWPDSIVDDSLIERDVIIGPGAVVRRSGIVRSVTVLGGKAIVECAADVEGVAGPGTIYMHPGQCWIVTGTECDLGAGNFFGTWRFDSKASKFAIRGRQVTPKEHVANATFFGDKVRSAVMVNFTPGTRIGSDTLIGPGVTASGTLEGGKGYLLKQDVVKARVGLLRR